MQPFRGTFDLLPDVCDRYRSIIETARRAAESYCFKEIQTPIFEYAKVFLHTLGETSDVVSKEMFTLTDRHGDFLALRPEGTAGVMRAVLSNKMEAPLKVFYTGPMFRYERPQKGRSRQFHQFGVESIGEKHPYADVEVISLGWHILQQLGLKESVVLELNTLGDSESRERYRTALVDYLEKYRKNLSAESQIRLDKNPLRILDSKDPADQKILAESPTGHTFLTSPSAQFFEDVQEGLSKANVPFRINSRIVRGLDYYEETAFEFTTHLLGAQNAVLAGGRYNGLSEKLGGHSLPSVGWAVGIERLNMLTHIQLKKQALISLIPLGNAAEDLAFKLLFDLRYKNFTVDLAWEGSLKSRFKRADRLGAIWAVVFGDDELNQQKVSIKNLISGEQQMIDISQLEDFLTKNEFRRKIRKNSNP